MIQPSSYSSIVTPKNFVRVLVGLWLFFTIVFGIISDYMTEVIMDLPEDPKLDGILYAGVYSGIMLSFFGITWNYLNTRFPITKPRNLGVHGLVQVMNLIVGITIGTILSGILHSLIFDLDYTPPKGKSAASLTLISMMCLIGMLSTSVIVYSAYYIQRTSEAERRNTKSELSALRAQINPHFLFNSLNSIAALIRISPPEAERVTEDLADLFRYTLRSSDRPMVTLREELEIIHLYLNIEQARFKERLTVQINVPEKLHSTCFPVLTLQPLIENSIKHGVSKKEGNHTVSLNISRHDDLLEIHIDDTGPGFPHHDFYKFLENGTGLSNVFQRLRLHFVDNVDGAIAKDGLRLRFPIEESPHSELNPLSHERVSGR